LNIELELVEPNPEPKEGAGQLLWRFLSRCFYIFAFVHMSAVISLR